LRWMTWRAISARPYIVVHVSVEEISRGWMWKYIPRPGEKVPRPRGRGMEDGARIGKGDDGVEVAGRSWITKTQSHREKANLNKREQVTSPTMKEHEQSLQGQAKKQFHQTTSFRVKAAKVLQDQFTPEQMKAQMEAAKAKVARWSRSFMIFQFYTVPGLSAVAAAAEEQMRRMPTFHKAGPARYWGPATSSNAF